MRPPRYPIVLALVCVACAHPTPTPPPGHGAPTSALRCPPLGVARGPASLELLRLVEPDPSWSHMLSGLWFDARGERFLAVRDNAPALVALRPDASFARWQGDELPQPFGAHTSLEGITGSSAGLVVSDEEEGDAMPPGPHVFFTATGALLAVPEHFRRARPNSGFEALSATPDGATLLVANERALTTDADGVLRVLATELSSRAQREYAYRLGPTAWADGDGDVGLSDFVALSPRRLLALERAWRRDRGSSVRVFLAELSGDDVIARDTLAADTPVAAKTLLLDVATLPRDADIAAAAGQPHPALGNYEGIAVGPCLPDGRRAVVLVTDDNDDSVRARGGVPQARRILVLAAAGL